MTEAPVLAQPESGIEYTIYTDALLNELGYVLMRIGKVVAYASYQFKPHERNYPTHDLEIVVVISALKIWRHYLYGEKCRVFSNHKRLNYLMMKKSLESRPKHWMEILKDYDLAIEYHLGKANVVDDALSKKIVVALTSLRARVSMVDDGSFLVELTVRQTFLF